MLIRALIVVLAIFNAGVALWWWSQPPVTDAPVPVMSPPEGVALLQLRSEVPVLAADAAAQDNALALPVAASAADNAAAVHMPRWRRVRSCCGPPAAWQ